MAGNADKYPDMSELICQIQPQCLGEKMKNINKIQNASHSQVALKGQLDSAQRQRLGKEDIPKKHQRPERAA